MNIKQWLARVTDGASVNAVAHEVRMTQTTLNGQVSGKAELKPETVVKIARAYNYSVVRALVDLGLIKEAEAMDAAGVEEIAVAAALARADDPELLTEIGRRLAERKSKSGTVTQLHPKSSAPSTTVPQKRSAKRRKDRGENEDDQ